MGLTPSKNKSKSRSVQFELSELILDMQREVASHLDDSSKHSLAMTCSHYHNMLKAHILRGIDFADACVKADHPYLLRWALSLGCPFDEETLMLASDFDFRGNKDFRCHKKAAFARVFYESYKKRLPLRMNMAYIDQRLVGLICCSGDVSLLKQWNQEGVSVDGEEVCRGIALAPNEEATEMIRILGDLNLWSLVQISLWSNDRLDLLLPMKQTIKMSSEDNIVTLVSRLSRNRRGTIDSIHWLVSNCSIDILNVFRSSRSDLEVLMRQFASNGNLKGLRWLRLESLDKQGHLQVFSAAFREAARHNEIEVLEYFIEQKLIPQYTRELVYRIIGEMQCLNDSKCISTLKLLFALHTTDPLDLTSPRGQQLMCTLYRTCSIKVFEFLEKSGTFILGADFESSLRYVFFPLLLIDRDTQFSKEFLEFLKYLIRKLGLDRRALPDIKYQFPTQSSTSTHIDFYWCLLNLTDAYRYQTLEILFYEMDTTVIEALVKPMMKNGRDFIKLSSIERKDWFQPRFRKISSMVKVFKFLLTKFAASVGLNKETWCKALRGDEDKEAIACPLAVERLCAINF